MNKIQSQTISLLRFPLTWAVVLLHSFILDESIFGTIYVPKGKFPFFEIFEHILKHGWADCAVPTFFVISGFLFFQCTEFTKETYKNKLKKRFKTLFIPFMFWNTLFIIYTFTIQTFFPSLINSKKYLLDYTLYDWFNAYWDLSQGLLPLWYIRDLLCMCIISPLLYHLLKKTKGFFIIFLLILYCTLTFVWINGFGIRPMLYFSIGAWMAINSNCSWTFLNKYRKFIISLYLLLIIIETLLWFNGLNTIYLSQILYLFGVSSTLSFASYLTDKKKISINSKLTESCFFIYVFHPFIISIPRKFWVFIVPVNELTCCLDLIISTTLITFVLHFIYQFFHTTFPKFTSIVVGGR